MVQILEGGRGFDAVERVDRAVRAALEAHLAGERPESLFLVPPGTDVLIASAEARKLEIPDEAGILMRTSGSTTGTGSIVAISWDALIASANATHEAFSGPGVWASQLPLHHIAGFQAVARTALVSLTTGDESIRSIYLDLSDPDAIQSALTRRNVAERVYLSVVPTQLQRVLANPPVLDALREAVFLVGGASTSDDVLRRTRDEGIEIHTSYGMTETCGGCVYDGLPVGDTEILLDENGRISLRGSAVALGYLGAAANANTGSPTEEDFSTDPSGIRTHHTKDTGRLVNGRLEVLGRTDDAITTGGLTVMPTLIEASLAKTGWDAVVVGVPHLDWGEAVVAVIQDLDNHAQSCNVTVMRSWVKLDLGTGWAPSYVVGLSDIGGEFPLTDSGKIDRRKLSDIVADYLGL